MPRSFILGIALTIAALLVATTFVLAEYVPSLGNGFLELFSTRKGGVG